VTPRRITPPPDPPPTSPRVSYLHLDGLPLLLISLLPPFPAQTILPPCMSGALNWGGCGGTRGSIVPGVVPIRAISIRRWLITEWGMGIGVRRSGVGRPLLSVWVAVMRSISFFIVHLVRSSGGG